MNNEEYYRRISALNIAHYEAEVPYYAHAPLRAVERALLRSLKPGSSILDVGCGSGRFSIGAAHAGFQVTGLDITSAAIEAARKRAAADNLHAEFIIGDMTDIPIESASFDYVISPRFSINAVATLAKRIRAVTEMRRVTRNSGSTYIETFNYLYMGRGPLPLLRNIARDVGRYFQMAVQPGSYSGLLPGDVTYRANKVLSAPIGFAHLPTISEIRSWVPRDTSHELRSIPQMPGSGRDAFKYFRYSIWLILNSNALGACKTL